MYGLENKLIKPHLTYSCMPSFWSGAGLFTGHPAGRGLALDMRCMARSSAAAGRSRQRRRKTDGPSPEIRFQALHTRTNSGSMNDVEPLAHRRPDASAAGAARGRSGAQGLARPAGRPGAPFLADWRRALRGPTPAAAEEPATTAEVAEMRAEGSCGAGRRHPPAVTRGLTAAARPRFPGRDEDGAIDRAAQPRTVPWTPPTTR